MSDGLRLEAVSVTRGGRPVVREVTMEIPRGQVTTLLGANGAGQVDARARRRGRAAPSGGRVLLGDRDLTGSGPEQVRAAGVAVVPEGRRLLPELTVQDNLRVATYSLAARARGTDRLRARALPRAREALARRTARLLSGGEQQMVVLAQALVSRPRTSCSSTSCRSASRPSSSSGSCRRSRPSPRAGVGVLLIEQFAHVALALAQSAYVIENGRIRYEGTAQKLKDEPEILRSAYLLREATAQPASPERARRGR